MKPNTSLSDLISRSSALIQESAQLRQRAKDTIQRSSVVIDRSRELLFSGLISGFPSLAPKASQSALPGSEQQALGQVRTSVAKAPEQVVDRDYVDETVVLDGRQFVNCTVTNCVLEYFGGPLILESTNFKGCRFRFGGEAAITVAVLQCFGILGEQSADFLPARTTARGPHRVN